MKHIQVIRKYANEMINDNETNHAWCFSKSNISEKSVLKLSKEFPNNYFWIIDKGRNARGWWPNISVARSGQINSLNVGNFCKEDLDKNVEPVFISDNENLKEDKISFFKNGKVIKLKVVTEKEYRINEAKENLKFWDKELEIGNITKEMYESLTRKNQWVKQYT